MAAQSIGNHPVSYFYEEWVECDRQLGDRGTIAEQGAQELRLRQLRSDPNFIGGSRAAQSIRGMQALSMRQSVSVRYQAYVSGINQPPAVIARSLMKSFIKFNEQEDCAICMFELEAPCDVSILGCNKNHFFHSECLDQWIEFNRRKYPRGDVKPTCPMCRKSIDQTKITKQRYEGVVDPQDIQFPDLELAKGESSNIGTVFADGQNPQERRWVDPFEAAPMHQAGPNVPAPSFASPHLELNYQYSVPNEVNNQVQNPEAPAANAPQSVNEIEMQVYAPRAENAVVAANGGDEQPIQSENLSAANI